MAAADMVPSDTFDFIVVGGGSAGTVLANKLAEDGCYNVALLEKGGEPNLLNQIPGLLPLMYFTDNVDRYLTEKQKGVGLGLKDQRIPWTKGKGLGGGSLVNNMIYTRGHEEDFDRWAAAGNEDWYYSDVLQFYRKLENAQVENIDTSIRGSVGEVEVVHLSSRSEAAKAFVEACKETGMPFMDDYINGKANGVAYVQTNALNGKRCHAQKAFLDEQRDWMKVITGALVTKVAIDPLTKAATGVFYVKDGSTFYAKAQEEVILSAGCLGSPQILMLSGIGPKHLQDMGIEVIQDLPVGRTIYDHIRFPGLFYKVNQRIAPTFHEVLSAENVLRFWKDGQGPLTIPAAVEALGFIQTPFSGETINYADVELAFMSASFTFDHGLFMRNQWGISDETYEAIWRPLEDQMLCSVFVMPFRPLSKGYMELRSVHPGEQPRFYGNYFTDPEGKDMKTMIAAIRKVQEIVAAPALAKYGAEIVMTPVPCSKNHLVDSDEFWECQVRHLASSAGHQVASCKMGPVDDPEAVVDNDLRVHGVRNLRVVDMSIAPTQISAHTDITEIMMGAKAADTILTYHFFK